MQDCIGLRAGVLDDQNIINETVPKIEVFPERRPKWRNKIEGAIQLKGQVEILEDKYWNKDGTPKSTGADTRISPNGRDLSFAEF